MTTYQGRTKWAVRRHDVPEGREPEVVVMEGYDDEAEKNARSMVRNMTEVCERNGWDNVPELLRAQIQWEVVDG